MSKSRARKLTVLGAPNEEPIFSRLDSISGELRGVAHLIERYRPGDPPTDIEDVFWGLGILLTEMSARLREISRTLDEEDVGKKRIRRSQSR